MAATLILLHILKLHLSSADVNAVPLWMMLTVRTAACKTEQEDPSAGLRWCLVHCIHLALLKDRIKVLFVSHPTVS